MRPLLALAVMVVALVAWLAFARQTAPQSTEVALERPSTHTSVAGENATELEMPGDSAAPTRVVEKSQAPGAVALGTAPGARCRVLGRVVDELGATVAGATIVLNEWGEFPEIVASHTTRSALDGRFAIELALKPIAKQSLELSAGDFYVRVDRWFGDVQESEGRRLVAGDIDVGDVKLQSCGIVEGLALDESGLPVAGVRVQLEGKSKLSSAGITGITDAAGRYSIRDAPPGPAVLSIPDREWKIRGKMTVQVEKARVTSAPDLVLAPVPTIEGIVVDENAKPRSGVTIRALDSFGRVSASAPSLDDGRFVIHVTDDEPLALEVRDVPGYRNFGGRHGDPSCTFPPGARGVRIVLERAPLMTFRIVDSASRAPIERFGIRLLPPAAFEQRWSVVQESIVLEDHPRGEAALSIPGDVHVLVWAPGYAGVQTPAAADAATANVQTITLLRASSITGRVRSRGEFVAGAKVWLERANIEAAVTVAPAKGQAGAPERFDVEAFPGRPRNTTTDERGEFTLPDLAAGTYALEIKGKGGAPITLRPLVVPREGTLALGDVELAPEAVVRGVVRTALGESAVGFSIQMGDKSVLVQSEDGAFEIRGLKAGPQWLLWQRGTGKRMPFEFARHRVDVVLAAGETREIVIDAADTALCTLRVHVVHNGRPAADAAVYVFDAETKRVSGSIGKTDAGGNLVARVEGGRRVVVQARSAAKHPLGATTIDTIAGGDVACSIDVELGTLTLELPATITRPEIGRVVVGSENGMVMAYAGSFFGTDQLPWSSNRIEFGEYPAGQVELEVIIESFEAPAPGSPSKSSKWIRMREPWKTMIEVRVGEETRVVVP